MADYDREGSAESEDFNPVTEIDDEDEPTSRPAARQPAAEEDEDEDDALGLTGNPDEDEEGAGVDLDNDDDDDDDDEDDDEDDVVVRISNTGI
jgi:transcription elongation factor SPT5